MPAIGTLKFVRSPVGAGAASFGRLLPQLLYMSDQTVDLLLLSIDHNIEFFEEIFGKAGLDLEFGQAGFDGNTLVGSGIWLAHQDIGTDLA